MPRTAKEGESLAEHFVPYLRDDIIEMCLEEDRLGSAESEAFRGICAHLVDYLHCRFLSSIDRVKRHYAPFDPDRETILRHRSGDSRDRSEAELEQLFEQLATDANYVPVDHEYIEKCFARETLIKLRTKVDLDDFDRVSCFVRGDVFKDLPVRRFFRERQQRVDVLQRVLLFLKLKDDDYFERTGKKHRTEMQPGKITKELDVGEQTLQLRDVECIWTTDGRYLYYPGVDKKNTFRSVIRIWDSKTDRYLTEVDGKYLVGPGPGPTTMVYQVIGKGKQSLWLHDAASGRKWKLAGDDRFGQSAAGGHVVSRRTVGIKHTIEIARIEVN